MLFFSSLLQSLQDQTAKIPMDIISKVDFLKFYFGGSNTLEEIAVSIYMTTYFNFLSLIKVTSPMLTQCTYWTLRFLAILWPFNLMLSYMMFKNGASSE